MNSMTADRKRILLVEDDEQSAQYVNVLLQNSWDLVVTAWADDAWEILSSEKIDLILMDISLPGEVNGLDLTRKIRQHEERSRIPIIAVTAHAFQQDKTHCLEAGCDAYISKPFERRELVSAIEELI